MRPEQPQREPLISGSRSRTGLLGDAVVFTATGVLAGGKSEMHWEFGDGCPRGRLRGPPRLQEGRLLPRHVQRAQPASDTVTVRVERPDLQIVWVHWKGDRLSVRVRTEMKGTIRASLKGYAGRKTFKDATAKSRTITFRPAKLPRLGQVRVEVGLSPTGRQPANVTKVARAVSVPISATRR